ncbi:MAG TPA: TonB-dependent receptor [Xanthomonadaceae bacterium]|nr:TonB-dependent receptor [Xanthomonadaceae bacterium]
MVKFKRNTLSVALASAILVFAGGAQAQSAQDPERAATGGDAEGQTDEARREREDDEAVELEAVTVTGIRRGIEGAISIKQDSTSIVEAISAEDIGKLPDSSIAESIARLPGLAAQRVAGRSSTISIRGLAGDFSTTLLNGREQVSSGDNRGVEFDQYPSELINAVVVYKTPDASLVATGISGTVDLQTVRPLAYGQRVVALNARLEKNSLGELNPGYDDTGYRFSASYIDQFADGTVGLALGFARLDSPGQANRWNAWGYPNDIGAAPGAFVLGGSESFSTSNSNKRNGFMGVLEFEPNDFYSGAVDVYYSTYDRVETTRGLQVGLGWSGASLLNPVVDDGLLISGTFDGVRPVLRNDVNTREDDIFAIGFNNQFQFNDHWKGVADFSLSKATRSESILETYAGTASEEDTVHVVIDPRTGLPTLSFGFDYADPNRIVLTDPGGWGQDGYIKFPEFEDELRSARFSLERTFDASFVRSFQFGANYSNREKSRSVAEAFLDLINRPTSIPADLLQRPANLSFTGIPGIIAYDATRAYRSLYATRTHLHPDILNKDWEVEETVWNVFAKLDIDTEIGSIPLRGNLGLQYVDVDQESRGFAVPGGNASGAQPFAGGAKYSDWLPSLNLVFELPYEQMVRFGAARSVARPRMDEMRANNGFGIDQTRNEWSGGGGNPELRPWRATGYDLSYEKYFGVRGYFAVAAFHKDLSSYIFNQTIDFDFSVFDLSGFEGPLPPSTIGRFGRPTNGDGGTINGLEYTLSLPFDLLSDYLYGFGMVASYADTRSSIQPLGPGTDQPLPGLSRYVSNVTLYYENHGFSARVSRRSRSAFIGEVQGFGADRETRYIEGEKLIDFQTSYDFGPGRLDGLTLLLQVNNVTNESYREFFRDPGTPDRPRSYNEYGRTILLGAIYKF